MMLANRRSQGSRHTRPAFTLVELVMSLAIVAMFSAVAVPRYGSLIARHRLQGATRRVMADLSLAARRAKLTSASQTVAFEVGANAYSVGDIMDPDHPSRPYRTVLDEAPYDATIVSADFGGDADLVFNGYGVPDSNGLIIIRVGRFRQTIPVSGAADGGVVVVDPKTLPKPEALTE